MTPSPHERQIEQLRKRVAQLEERERAREHRSHRVRLVALGAGLVLAAVSGLMPWYTQGQKGYPLTENNAELAAYDVFLVVVPLVATVVLGVARVVAGSDRLRFFVAVPATWGALGTAATVLSFQGAELEEWQRTLTAAPWVCLVGFVLVAVSEWLAAPEEWDRGQWR